MSSLIQGFGDVKRGASYLASHKSLFKYLIVPTLINLTLFVLLGYVMIKFYGDLFVLITKPLAGLAVAGDSWWVHILSGLMWLLQGLLYLLLGLVLMIVLVVSMLLVSQIINAPFYDWISEAVEKKETGLEDVVFSFSRLVRDIGRMIKMELMKLVFFVMVPLFLLLINFIPLIGSLIYTILANLFVAWDMGFNYVSYPMSRKLMPFKEQLRFGLKNKFRLIGFGIPLMIPFFNLLFAPLFVVGGTLFYLDTLKDQSS